MDSLTLKASKKTKSTPAGEIPVDWGSIHIQEIVPDNAPVVYGIVQAGPHVADGIPYIRSTDVGGKIDPDQLLRTSSEIARKHRRSTVIPGDIVFSLRGNIGESSLVPESLSGANLTQGTARIRTDSKGDSRFFRYALMHDHALQRILAVAKGSTFREITLDDLRQISVPLPPLPEQRKIADILSTWDEALERLDALIAAKNRRKQALMQQLLARSSAHSEVAHARHRLGEVCERVTRRNRAASENVLTISAQHGLVSQQDYFNRSVAGADLSNYYLLHRGEFAYNRSSAKGYPYGAIKRLNQYDQGVVSTLYLCFRIRAKAAVSSAYLCHYFEAGLLNHGLRTIAKEGARAHGLLNVTSEDFFDLDIFLPTLREQEKFADILDTADEELALLRRQRNALDQQKRGLMQRLLTGKIRVSTENAP